MDIEKTTKKILELQELAKNKFRDYEECITANVDLTNILADIQYELDIEYANIVRRPDMQDKPTNYVERIYKAETAELRRLLTLAKSLKHIFVSLEYTLSNKIT